MQLNISLLLLCLSAQSTLCGPTKREASPDADADADADPGHLVPGHPAVIGPVPPPQEYTSEPVCNSVPQRHCQPRQIENPREECHTETDTIVDTIVTEHCEEVITTQCTQTSQSSRTHSAVVGQDSQVVSTGVSAHHGAAVAPVAIAHGAVAPVAPGFAVHGGLAHGGVAPVAVAPGFAVHGGLAHGGVAPVASAHGHIGKREAAADAEASPDADAHGYTPGPSVAHEPVCASHPVRTCNKVPEQRPRQVSRVVCKQVVDVTTIEDCQDVITTQCQQVYKKVAHSSSVVGQDTRLVQGPRVVSAGPSGPAVAPVAVGPAVGHAIAAGPVIGPARGPLLAGVGHGHLG